MNFVLGALIVSANNFLCTYLYRDLRKLKVVQTRHNKHGRHGRSWHDKNNAINRALKCFKVHSYCPFYFIFTMTLRSGEDPRPLTGELGHLFGTLLPCDLFGRKEMPTKKPHGYSGGKS